MRSLLFSGAAFRAALSGRIISGKQPPFEATAAQWSESHKLGISMVKFSLFPATVWQTYIILARRNVQISLPYFPFTRALPWFLDKGALITHKYAACRPSCRPSRELCSALLSAWAINYAKNTISASAPFSQINLSPAHTQPFAQEPCGWRVKMIIFWNRSSEKSDPSTPKWELIESFHRQQLFTIKIW